MTRNRPDTSFKKMEGRALPPDQDFALSSEESVHPDIEFDAIARPDFTVEWGIRQSDGALVLHFYPKIVGDNVAAEWDPKYRMDKRLEVAMPEVFDTKALTAGFETTHNSFYIVAHNVISPDPRLLVQRFLEKIEGAPLR